MKQLTTLKLGLVYTIARETIFLATYTLCGWLAITGQEGASFLALTAAFQIRGYRKLAGASSVVGLVFHFVNTGVL